MTDMLEAALEYATLGWPIFPARHNKTPYTLNGVLDATADLEQVRRWWEKWPGANVALAAGEAGLLILDYDPGSDRRAVERAVPDLPETKLMARTPRGGTHEYYLLDPGDPPVPPRASPFAEHVDTRSFHSYVLLPPSRTADGTYEWTSRGRPARRSDGLLAACGRGREKSKDRDAWRIPKDLPDNVALARAWLRGERDIGSSRCKPAMQGGGGDNTTYATAAMMKSCGLSEGTALELLWEEYNPRCDPPWEHEELAAKVRNGYSYNTSPPGNVTPAYHVASGLFQPAVEEELGEGRQITSGRFRFVDRAALQAVTPPGWLIPDAIPEDSYVMLAGPSGSYKTFIALDAALTIATGGPALRAGEWRGLFGAPARPGAVLFAVGEGRAGLRQRVEAWERLHLGGERASDFTLADPVPHVHEGVIEKFAEGALALHPEGYRLVVLDTVSRAMQGANENAQENATAFTRLADDLRRALGCAVLALHHTGHEHHDRARGSSAFLGDPDTILMALRHAKGLSRVCMAKQKDWPEWDDYLWASLETVILGDGRISLATTKGEAPKQAPGGGKVTLALVDQHVLAALRRHEGREFSDRALAGTVAAEGLETEAGDIVGLGLGERTLRGTWLPALREAGSGARCREMYDPAKERWRYGVS